MAKRNHHKQKKKKKKEKLQTEAEYLYMPHRAKIPNT